MRLLRVRKDSTSGPKAGKKKAMPGAQAPAAQAPPEAEQAPPEAAQAPPEAAQAAPEAPPEAPASPPPAPAPVTTPAAASGQQWATLGANVPVPQAVPAASRYMPTPTELSEVSAATVQRILGQSRREQAS